MNIKYLVSLILISSLYAQSSFRGKPCDDTEVRNYDGLPAWKNYGEWLSECDSLADAYADSTFAIILEERNRKQLEEDKRREEEIASIDVDLELDMDAMWDNTVWNEITDIAESEGYEIDNSISEEVIGFGEVLPKGDYKLANDILNNEEEELSAKKGDKVVAYDDEAPVDTILGVDIFPVVHVKTQEKIYVGLEDLVQ